MLFWGLSRGIVCRLLFGNRTCGCCRRSQTKWPCRFGCRASTSLFLLLQVQKHILKIPRAVPTRSHHCCPKSGSSRKIKVFFRLVLERERFAGNMKNNERFAWISAPGDGASVRVLNVRTTAATLGKVYKSVGVQNGKRVLDGPYYAWNYPINSTSWFEIADKWNHTPWNWVIFVVSFSSPTFATAISGGPHLAALPVCFFFHVHTTARRYRRSALDTLILLQLHASFLCCTHLEATPARWWSFDRTRTLHGGCRKQMWLIRGSAARLIYPRTTPTMPASRAQNIKGLV